MVDFSIAPDFDRQKSTVNGSIMDISYINTDWDFANIGKSVVFDQKANVHVDGGIGHDEHNDINCSIQLKSDGHNMVLHAGKFHIKLHRDLSPIMRFVDGFYVVSKPEETHGLDLMIDFRPYSVPFETLVTFESVLRYYAVLEVRSGMNFVYLSSEESTDGVCLPDDPVTPEQRKERSKCDYIITAGTILAKVVHKTGDVATAQMKNYAEKKRLSIKEQEASGDVDPKTVKRLQQTESLTSYALQGANVITGALDMIIGKGTEWAAGKGAKSAVDKDGKETKTGAMMRGAGAGLVAWNLVWEAAEDSAMKFLIETEVETTDYCMKVYGPNGAEAATHACQSAQKAGKAGYKVGTLGAKQVVKKSAKQIGKNYTTAAAEAAKTTKAPVAHHDHH